MTNPFIKFSKFFTYYYKEAFRRKSLTHLLQQNIPLEAVFVLFLLKRFGISRCGERERERVQKAQKSKHKLCKFLSSELKISKIGFVEKNLLQTGGLPNYPRKMASKVVKNNPNSCT